MYLFDTAIGLNTAVKIEKLKLQQPVNAYFSTAKNRRGSVDVYEEAFGVRKVEVTNGKSLIKDNPFYFRGVFTRARETKMVVRYLSQRWNKIPVFCYKK